jgi:L-lactate dehydrogenase complex protein LldG
MEFPLLIADLQDRHIEFIDPVIPENIDATVQKALVRTYDEIPLGITSVSAGLAETGSIVLSSKSVRSNFASLLPHVHIAILREENIYQDFSKWIVERASDVVGETTVIITGPSRTADIEMTLTIGVHGPTHLIVCLITKDTEILTM